MKKKKFVWVVEMKFETWQPCGDCGVTMGDAKEKLVEWRRLNPNDCFRIRKYYEENP